MKCKYRGFDIYVFVGKNISNENMNFHSITRLSDGWELDCGYFYNLRTMPSRLKGCKLIVDDYYENPNSYED